VARLLAILLAGIVFSQTDTVEEWRRLGLARISGGQLKLATPALEKACALETAPGGDSCYYLARNLHSLGEFEAARKAFDLALKAAPSSLLPKVLRATALNYMALGQNDEAERDLRRAMKLGQSGADDVRVDLGAFLFRQGRSEEALKLLEAAVQGDPESARANLESGRVLLQLGQLEAASKRLEKATGRNPADWNAHLLLGRAYQRMGRDAEAERELQLGESEWRRKQPGSP
jgi:Tfp pilus assembly protein PilF